MMRPNPFDDVLAFLTKPAWPTAVFWLLLVASGIIAVAVWRREPALHTPKRVGIWLLRIIVGAMWWQQSLWKIPPNFDGLRYWMQQMVEHASIALQSKFVAVVVLPRMSLFGPLIYMIEVAIGISLMLGVLTRLGALLGALMAINLWLGLYSAPGEWPWTYFFLVIIQCLFIIEPPGRCLGVDAILSRKAGSIRVFRLLCGSA